MAKPRVFKNARREVLARLAEIRDSVAWLRNGFTVASTVYESHTASYTAPDSGETRYYENSKPRPRRYEEYPENNPANWGALYAEADRLTALASSLREFADQQYRETISRNTARSAR